MNVPNSLPACAVDLVGVTKFRGTQAVLRQVSARIPQGQVVALLGPSGAGKSTLLRCVNHLEPIDDGQIFVEGELIAYRERNDICFEMSDRDVSRQRQRIGMVFQSFNLFRHMKVLDNVMSGPRYVMGQSRSQAEHTARALLERVGLSEKAGAYPHQLSGGQQQRVAIARALAMSPRVMLLDEPTSALDPELAQEVIAVIRQLASENITMLIATHEMRLARDFADRVLFMVGGELVEDAPARRFFDDPQHARSKQFVSRHSHAA